jgi:glycogen synthase
VSISASVVICTLNRAESLDVTLSALRHQRHRNFEVVVVNGPSDDHTDSVLRRYEGDIIVRKNDHRNLSMSRNMGILASSGAFVAFIDDDAIPEFDWLEQAITAFDSDEVGGVGGLVLDHTGMNPQYMNSAADRLGATSVFVHDNSLLLSVPGAALFPYLQGTNAVFRRDVLERVGMFDETFEFYLDETDLCCRIIDAGYVLKQLDNAVVHHKYLPSSIRNEHRVVTNWYSVVKNRTYFGLRHGVEAGETAESVVESVRDFIAMLLEGTRQDVAMGLLPDDHVETARAACDSGLRDGLVLGQRAVERIPHTTPPQRSPTIRYPTIPTNDPLRLVIVTSGYTPEVTGGIARFFSDLAPELARRGHEVRVFARSSGTSTVEFEEGVWVHRLRPTSNNSRLPDAPPAVDAFASAAADELIRVSNWWTPDVVYGSMWDVELLGIQRDRTASVVPMLATPMAEVASHEGWHNPESEQFEAAGAIIPLEGELVRNARLVHAVSAGIVRTFDLLYPDSTDGTPVVVEGIGRRADEELGSVAEARAGVLFVGRLEPRKGFDVLLEAIPRVLAVHPDARFRIAGSDLRLTSTDRAIADRYSAQKGSDDGGLEFLGEISDHELSEALRQSAILVVPSRYESFGLVAVEGMMHGCAVIASDVGGLREVISNGVTGLLTAPGDGQALATAIVRLLDDRALCGRLASAGQKSFVTQFEISSVAGRIEQMLRSAVQVDVSPPTATRGLL